ncbi:MAG: peptide MFS transporter [candidate division KSB1 bacterium]|nr:peptide MFS transporter [candidate division KSB1 bacterium]
MLKEHPKGLYVAFFTNMGERFGFYTMMAILVLFLQARYGLSEQQAGSYYSWFYFAIYALALVGGLLADWTRRYKTVILVGLLIMFGGYGLLSLPGNPLAVTLIGLLIIAFGNGMFKGNLQAVVGQLYDDPRYSKVRDAAFMIFYMGINVGAFFAPFAATAVRNWFLKTQGFLHDGSLPSLCHAFLRGELSDIGTFRQLAEKVSLSQQGVTDLKTFAESYLGAFSRGYNYAFGVAAGAMILSTLVYLFFHRHLPDKAKTPAVKTASLEKKPLAGAAALAAAVISAGLLFLLTRNIDISFAVALFIGFVAWIVQVSTKEERPRVAALLLVFLVVIFFWMSFHQNGLTLTFFARDYTVKAVGPITFLFFRLNSMLAVIGAAAGLFLLLLNPQKLFKLIGLVLLLGCGGLTAYYIMQNEAVNPIAPEVFQSFNPLFIVALTFPIMGFFSWLNKRNLEPSTPKKIGIGMIIAAAGFLVVLVASLKAVSPHALQFIDEFGRQAYNPVPDSSRVSPYWLISSYLILTIAELFLSPMGLSFVSKVAPPRFQGIMQGGWLLATAVGNKLLFVGSFFWAKLELWQLWGIFVACCLLSAAFIFSIMKRLEQATQG